MHCDNLGLVLGLGLVRVSSRVWVKVRVNIMVRVSIRTSWMVNFAARRLSTGLSETCHHHSTAKETVTGCRRSEESSASFKLDVHIKGHGEDRC